MIIEVGSSTPDLTIESVAESLIEFSLVTNGLITAPGIHKIVIVNVVTLFWSSFLLVRSVVAKI